MLELHPEGHVKPQTVSQQESSAPGSDVCVGAEVGEEFVGKEIGEEINSTI